MSHTRCRTVVLRLSEHRFDQGALLAITVPGGHYVCLCCGLFYPIQRPVSANVEDRMHQSNTVPKRMRQVRATPGRR